MNSDCIFCKIGAGEILVEKIFEDENFYAILDIKPVNLGHVLLIPKAHHQNLFDLPDNLLRDLGSHLQKLAKAVKEATEADGINIGMNNEPAAGQLVMHQHTHIIPRFTGDGFESWHGQEAKAEDLQTTREKIKACLQK